jgi:hypothetical protein
LSRAQGVAWLWRDQGGAVAVPAASSASAASYRSHAARWAARSSRLTLRDLAGLSLLMNAPCPHREQINTRGSDAAVANMPELGKMIRVSRRRVGCAHQKMLTYKTQ